MVRVVGDLGAGSGYRVPVVVSTQPFASLTCWLNQLWGGMLRDWVNQLRGGMFTGWLNQLLLLVPH